MTICVCVTSAQSLPSLRVIRVCQTMVVRPRCSGVHSARAVSPTGMAAKKLVLLSMVAVRAPFGKIRHRGDAAEIIGERHDGAAVEDVGDCRKLVTNGEFGLDALRRDVREFDAEEIGERCLHFGGSAHDASFGNS